MKSLTTIGELLGTGALIGIQDGNHGEKHPTSADYVQEGGVPFLMARDFHGDRLDVHAATRLRREVAEKLRIGFAKPGDVLLTHKGTVGCTGIVPDGVDYVMLTPQVTYYRTDPKKLLARYLRCAFRAPHFQHQLANFSAQSTRPFVSITAQRGLAIPAPPLDEQRRIAGVLSAYDDLIENCERRIRVLDEMERALYREWFGPSDAGDVRRLSDVAEVLRGRSYRSSDLGEEGGVPFVNLKCVARDGGFRRDGIKRFVGEPTKAHLISKGAIIVAVTDMTQERRIVARAARVPQLDGSGVGVFSMDLVRLVPRSSVDDAWLYCYLRYSTFADHLKLHANGANVLHLGPDRLKQHSLRLPAVARRREFGDRCAPLFESGEVLQTRIENLRRTRDLLLPRLLSGQLSLKDAEAAA